MHSHYFNYSLSLCLLNEEENEFFNSEHLVLKLNQALVYINFAKTQHFVFKYEVLGGKRKKGSLARLGKLGQVTCVNGQWRRNEEKASLKIDFTSYCNQSCVGLLLYSQAWKWKYNRELLCNIKVDTS